MQTTNPTIAATETAALTKLQNLSFVVATLCGLGFSLFALKHFLEVNYLRIQGPSFCNINAAINCDAVSASRYSELFGLPLACYGIFFYLALLFFLFSAHRIATQVVKGVLLTAAAAGALISVVLFLISEFAVGSLCLMCLGTYLVNFALLFLAMRTARRLGIVPTLNSGIKDLLAFVPLALGIRRTGNATTRSFARMGLLTLFLVAAASLSVPGLMLQFLRAGEQATPHLETPQPESYVRAWQEQPQVDIDVSLDPAYDMDFYKGPLFAPVRIIEFSDYECPACRTFHGVMQQITSEFGEKVLLVYRNYPLDNACNPSMEREMHHNACFAAQFARCAGEQDKFWPATDYLFSLSSFAHHEAPEIIRKEILDGIGILKLDSKGLIECMDSERQRKKLLDDIRLGNGLQLDSTPSVWVNGRRVVVPRLEAMRAVISYILQGPKR